MGGRHSEVARRARAAAGSLVFLVVAPGVVAGLGPWWRTGWRLGEPLPFWLPLRVAGLVLVAAGLIVLLQAFARFVVEGLGTPAPIAPTELREAGYAAEEVDDLVARGVVHSTAPG